MLPDNKNNEISATIIPKDENIIVVPQNLTNSINHPIDFKQAIYEFAGNQEVLFTVLNNFVEDLQNQIKYCHNRIHQKP